MKKVTAIILTGILTLGVLTGCQSNSKAEEKGSSEDAKTSDNSLLEFRYACKWIVPLVFDLLSAPLHSHEDCEASELHLRHSSLAHQKMPDTPTE